MHFNGLYDFLYLPMDFKNKCNIGYAFINLIEPKCVINFFNEFHNKKWYLFRSEKVSLLLIRLNFKYRFVKLPMPEFKEGAS